MVDDPYEYGRIAAVNSLSDVYAMGGEPKLALNIFCFPEDLPKQYIQAILQGGYEKVMEADALITGGHTIQDSEPKYGLSVTGFTSPDKVIRNNDVKPGDVLILTKALGTGILTTAAKADLIEERSYDELISSMTTLNRYAASIMKPFNVNSCTDVTGFGLMGHAFEMAHGSGVTLHIDHKELPLLREAVSMAESGIIPSGAYRNREYLQDVVKVGSKIPLAFEDIMYDPQTAGGLLISVPEKEGFRMIREAGADNMKVIGWADETDEYSIIVS